MCNQIIYRLTPLPSHKHTFQLDWHSSSQIQLNIGFSLLRCPTPFPRIGVTSPQIIIVLILSFI